MVQDSFIAVLNEFELIIYCAILEDATSLKAEVKVVVDYPVL